MRRRQAALHGRRRKPSSQSVHMAMHLRTMPSYNLMRAVAMHPKQGTHEASEEGQHAAKDGGEAHVGGADDQALRGREGRTEGSMALCHTAQQSAPWKRQQEEVQALCNAIRPRPPRSPWPGSQHAIQGALSLPDCAPCSQAHKHTKTRTHGPPATGAAGSTRRSGAPSLQQRGTSE